MRLPLNTTVLIADGGGACFYRNVGGGDGISLELIESSGNQTLPARDPGEDRAGRLPAPDVDATTVGSADRQAGAEIRFASYVARRADALLPARAGRLVVMAPPRFLGQLRRCFSTSLEDRVLASMPVDLRNLTVRAIERALVAA